MGCVTFVLPSSARLQIMHRIWTFAGSQTIRVVWMDTYGVVRSICSADGVFEASFITH